jgi:hypothetical protein
LNNKLDVGPKVTEIEDHLASIGVHRDGCRLIQNRIRESHTKLTELSSRLQKKEKWMAPYTDLTIYAAGSYGRGEAGPHSDIDLFFVHDDKNGQHLEDPTLKGIRVISTVIREVEDEMDFPPPSNDGQFLNIMNLKSNLLDLGSPADDFNNYFTSRVLMLIEGRPVYGFQAYDDIFKEFVNSYLRDYEDHAADFRPTFLVNDIIRFWKTLCLNYENRRNQPDQPPERKLKSKIRNFKLKFSRMNTCFATITLLASYNTIDDVELYKILRLSPIERLLLLCDRDGTQKASVARLLDDYCWFLDLTGISMKELEERFSDKVFRTAAFKKADHYGGELFNILKSVAESKNTLRYLLI